MSVDGHNGLTLVLGGARSGKSRFAEKLAADSGRQKMYLATSQALDDEMVKRIEKHRQDRGDGWKLLEEPLELASSLGDYSQADKVILVDCLTLWLSNLMMANRDVEKMSDVLTDTLHGFSDTSQVILVSNEVGQGIVPIEKMSRDFRDHAGRLHQKLAQVCGHVWFVTAGLPQKLK